MRIELSIKAVGFVWLSALLGCLVWLTHLGGCLEDCILLQIVGHVGAKMGNKEGKMVSKSAKMSQHKV